MSKHVPPGHKLTAFNCALCNAFAKQEWFFTSFTSLNGYGYEYARLEGSRCERCKKETLWLDKQIIFPTASSAPLPNDDLPDGLKADYLEARNIAQLSPRGAGALLRLVIQKLCKHLGEAGKNINDDIKSLVAKGLPAQVQQALDIVRVIGNNCVHPGQIDMADDPATVNQLFKLVNFIVDKMISEPKEIKDLFDGLPEDKKAEIDHRDNS